MPYVYPGYPRVAEALADVVCFVLDATLPLVAAVWELISSLLLLLALHVEVLWLICRVVWKFLWKQAVSQALWLKRRLRRVWRACDCCDRRRCLPL